MQGTDQPARCSTSSLLAQEAVDASFAHMLDESCWANLPDMDHSSWDSHSPSLFDTDFGSLTSTDLYPSGVAHGLETDPFAIENFEDPPPDFDVAALLADADKEYNITELQNKLQTGALTANLHQSDALQLQSGPQRSCTPSSRNPRQHSSCKHNLGHLVSILAGVCCITAAGSSAIVFLSCKIYTVGFGLSTYAVCMTL